MPLAGERIFIVVLLAFIGLAVNVGNADARPAKRVLLLNSYSLGIEWTANITKGVEEVLDQAGIPIKLSVEFMDTKNYYSPEHFELLKKQYQLKYGGVVFDAVITSDDNAANFAMAHRHKLFNGAPIVFCGVNNLDFPKRNDFKNITGILESPDMVGSIRAALALQPGVKTIYVINDFTTTGKINRLLMEKAMLDFVGDVDFAWIENMSMDEVKETLSNLPGNSAVLLLGLNRDREGTWFTFSECITQLHGVSRTPIYSMWDFYLGEGIVGGMLTSGHYQGVTAAKMALEIIGGKNPEEVPVVTQKANRYMFDYNVLERFKLDQTRLPEGSILINVPESMYGKYQYEIWTISGVILFLFVVILRLLANNRARRQAEQELEELNEYQERLIEQRTEELTCRSRDLELANYELKKLDELKTAVLNTVSHDLRTPLTSVLGFCKLIDRDFNKFFLPLCSGTHDLEDRSDRIRGNLAIIEKEGERLTRLINDFLDLSKIESGDIAWNDVAVDPAKLLEQATPILEGYFSDTGVSLDMNIGKGLPRVIADPDRLLQVLNNLIGNAAKFTYHGKVTLTADTTEGGWLRITVTDTGVGVSEEELNHIFDNFYQVTQPTNGSELSRGSGMGLAISKRIVEHYGGSIVAKSEPDIGSSFIFTIPSAG